MGSCFRNGAATFMTTTLSPVQQLGAEVAPRLPFAANRAPGEIALRFALRGGISRAVDIREADGYKVRLPRSAAKRPEAVIINTGGGMAGGDRLEVRAKLEAGTAACITTPSAERIYRALDQSCTQVSAELELGSAASLEWLPQETIIFDGARLTRCIRIEMRHCARMLFAETLVFGRTAMGEQIKTGKLRDRWEIWREGRLALFEAISLDGAISQALRESAVTGGMPVVATVIYVADDCADRLGAVKDTLVGYGDFAAASSWNGVLVLRIVAPDTMTARTIQSRSLPLLSGNPLPRVWAN